MIAGIGRPARLAEERDEVCRYGGEGESSV